MRRGSAVRPQPTLHRRPYSFLFAASATLLTPPLIAFFASPLSCCASPFTSCAAPLPFNLSEPTALPTPCLIFPAASLAIPAALSVFPLMSNPFIGLHGLFGQPPL